jgi:acyl transferase domain-containing protein/acyl carrier protein
MTSPIECQYEEVAEEIAVIGLSGRFPGARDVQQYWRNIRDGVESITHFTDRELEALGVAPQWLTDPDYVKSGTVLDEFDTFDAFFFGYAPGEAESIDPQQRIFLETAWLALESAGYDPETYDGPIGVFGGCNRSDYLSGIPADLDLGDSAGAYERMIGNEKDYLCTRVSYKLNLRGPALSVQTACSTSLVAVQVACQSLLNYQCSLALAGGVAVNLKGSKGYFYQDGMILSRDGRCRAFDADASGTVAGQGVGVVVLKRLSEALSDGDTIYAVIKGVAINNDGSGKASYTAPSVDGQAEAIAMAHALSGVQADTIGYVEAHGTGTILGDPIEIAALTRAFRSTTDKKGFCGIGSVKTNIGHADSAAGIAGLIKTVLMLKNRQIPPSLHFKRPNPNIDFENSPFYVVTELSEWQDRGTPRRAGVSALGLGGTNVHAVLEEAPDPGSSEKGRPWQLLPVSARTPGALEQAAANLVEHLKNNPDQNLSDAAYTLGLGRKVFQCRRIAVCKDGDGAVNCFGAPDTSMDTTPFQSRDVVFMFSGQGSQYAGMGLELYRTESVFREAIDRCAEILRPHLALSLGDLLYPEGNDIAAAEEQLKQTSITQPALFAVEYALARLWMSWGVHPSAMVGHSIGEYVAACLAGVFPLEDALQLVAARGRLMQQMPTGSMLAVQLSEHDLERFLGQDLCLAAVNAPSLCVVSGKTEAVRQLERDLEQSDVMFATLHTSHAFHSEMMDPILEPFTEMVGRLRLSAPQIPFMSNLTGTWITAEQAVSPAYWAKHLRHAVRFSSCLEELLKTSNRILLEVGPGKTLRNLAREHLGGSKEGLALSSLRHPKEQTSDCAFILNALGRIWLAGGEVDWSGFYRDQRRRRVPLPGYPFERQRFWIDVAEQTCRTGEPHGTLKKKPDLADWFYAPSWERSLLPLAEVPSQPARSSFLVFTDECGIGNLLIQRLQQVGRGIVAVKAGSRFAKTGDNSYVINHREAGDYELLFGELRKSGGNPAVIIHLWGVTGGKIEEPSPESNETVQDLGLYSLLNIAKAIGKQDTADEVQINVVTSNMRDVTGNDLLCPEKATVLGAVRVMPLEYPGLTCRSIDILLPERGSRAEETLLHQLAAELAAKSFDAVVGYRGNYRWLPTMKPVRLEKPAQTLPPRLREKGVYLITGGFGGMGFTLAQYLAKTLKARLILLGRADFPAREDWGAWLMAHDAQDSVSLRIRKVREMEESGAEVLVFSADVSDYSQMQKVIDSAFERFGKINGVLHTSALADYAGIIQERSREETENILAPKVNGTLVLDKILKNAGLDLFVLFSSIGNQDFKAQFGQVGYNAANEFLDAFAHFKCSRDATFTVSINWDAWQEVGMAVEAHQRKLSREKREDIDHHFPLKDGLSPAEGIGAFNRIIAAALPQVAVSTVDLKRRVESRAKDEPSGRAEPEAPEKKRMSALHPRPDLQHPYAAPESATEEVIAGIWQGLLGIEKVGINDNFFELGGSSLHATQVISRIRKAFQIELPFRRFFELACVAQLSAAVEEILIAEIEALPEDEAQRIMDGIE